MDTLELTDGSPAPGKGPAVRDQRAEVTGGRDPQRGTWENGTSGSMTGYWGLDKVALIRHRQTKGAGTGRLDLSSGYPALLYPISDFSIGD